MGRTLHNLTRLILMSALAFMSMPSSAECISPLITPTECDFKNEDTHLWLVQPGHYHQREENLDTLINDTKKSITDYVASIKADGDALIVPHLGTIETAINNATIQAAGSVGIILANDPFSLKTIYLDIERCIPYWTVVYSKNCPTTAELPLLFNRTQNLLELQTQIDQIRANPFRVLGQEWGDIGDDLNEIKAEFSRGRTLARNIPAALKGTELDIRFPTYQQMLVQPRMNYATFQAQRTELSTTVQDTILDSLKASAMSNQGQQTEDKAEIERLHAMGRNAMGMMQEIEVSNMHRVNAAGAWTKIIEQQMNLGNFIGVDMADELYKEDRQAAEDTRAMVVDPLNPTVLGDEPAPFLR